jgi:hypothetical protein
MSDYTDEDVKEMFRRQNASKPLSGKLLRVCNSSDEFSDAVYSLANHPFMNKLITPAQRKNGTDRDLIIQTLMLISTNDKDDFASFRNKDIDIFVREYGDFVLDKTDILKEAMDNLDLKFDEIKIKRLNIPMILFVAYRCVKDKKSFEKLSDIISEFENDYNNNAYKLQEYKSFCQSATSSSDNVRGRLNYWRKIIREL